ncbi:hypothetical protein Btru_071589 [Bulinus truncatus]|nr:hypothetical protein Btru_071589 [Bulinus truncatus]
MADESGYECEDSGIFEIDLKLPNGEVKPNFNFLTYHTVSEEKQRIVKEEKISIDAETLVMIKHCSQGLQKIMNESEKLETFDLDDCSLIELELLSKAKEYEGRKPNEKNLNICFKIRGGEETGANSVLTVSIRQRW